MPRIRELKAVPETSFVRGRIKLQGPCFSPGSEVWMIEGINYKVGHVQKIEGNTAVIDMGNGTIKRVKASEAIMMSKTPDIAQD